LHSGNGSVAGKWLLCFTAATAAGDLQALEKADGVAERITWDLFKETLLEQAEQVRPHKLCPVQNDAASDPTHVTLCIDSQICPCI
jgi:hypothetical protein